MGDGLRQRNQRVVQDSILAVATAVRRAAVQARYNTNADNFQEYCNTAHYTSSCQLDFDEMLQEQDWSAASLAGGGKLHEISGGRLYCKEIDSDFVRLMNFYRYHEAVLRQFVLTRNSTTIPKS